MSSALVMTGKLALLISLNSFFKIPNNTRGSGLNSRLANYYGERFIGFGFLALGYVPPTPNFDVDATNALSLKTHGYENFGYWHFFNRDDSAEIIENHVSCFTSLIYSFNC